MVSSENADSHDNEIISSMMSGYESRINELKIKSTKYHEKFKKSGSKDL